MDRNTDKPDYRGLRALLLTRVSTEEQAKKYSHGAQERKIREILIEPLGLRLDEERHIIHDTYSGLEYRYREALERILDMAQRGEFDVLCMDVLDRGLGRKALAREIFRMQLRELGVRILTTDPSDHADDDSLEGTIMRFIKGSKAEYEIIDLVRRTSDGKREKALGDVEKGIPQKIVGQGHRLYGYTYIHEGEERVGFELNYTVILKDEEGVEWSEVSVVVFIFVSLSNGIAMRQIAKILNDKKIPTPYMAHNLHLKSAKHPEIWQAATISRMVHKTAYYGEYREGKTQIIGRQPGRKHPVRRRTTPDEQIVIPIPAIVSKELWQEAQEASKRHKQFAARNNQQPEDTLLRGGLAICGECGGTLRVHRIKGYGNNRDKVTYISYNCNNYGRLNLCPGCYHHAEPIDRDAWLAAIEIIRNPSMVDEKVEEWRKADPTAERRKLYEKTLRETQTQQRNLRKNLAEFAKGGLLDAGTKKALLAELQSLASKEEECKQELAKDEQLHIKWRELQERLTQFHKRCEEWRKKIDDPDFIPSYKFKRDACEFFGIYAIVWKEGHDPRYKIRFRSPSIVSLLSSARQR